MSDIDILNNLDNLDLSGVSTDVPVLAPGLYEVNVAEVKAEENRKKTGHTLRIKLTILNPAKTVDDKDVNAGFPLYDQISLVQTEKYDPRQNLARFKEGVTGSKEGSFTPLEQYLNQTAVVQVSVEHSEEYGTQNRVKRYVKKA